MKAAPSARKLRGGYYTPPAIARFLAAWAVRAPTDEVLEPSCGDGALLVAAREAGATRMLAFDVEADEAAKAREASGAEVRVQDFGAACAGLLAAGARFDAVLGNPPFVRYQSWPEEHRAPAFALMEAHGLKPTRLTNAWVPFLVGASLLAREEGGRLAMVVPAELFQVGYAAETRRFLADHFRRVTIVTFERLVFDGIQQEVVLLLCERARDGPQGIRVAHLADAAALARATPAAFADAEMKPLDHTREKWTKYYLSGKELALLRALRDDPRVARSGDVLDVDVGVVTGQNAFFVLDRAEARRRRLLPWTVPLVSRAMHLPGLRVDAVEWRALSERDQPVHLLDLPRVAKDALPAEARAYVEEGEARGLDATYKCRIRRPWHATPSPWAPDAFFLRQVDAHPKLVVNAAGATCTDTLHRARLKERVDVARVACAFLNSMTFAFAEVTGRSYGGGVLTFEPSEAEALPLPLRNLDALDPARADAWLRAGRLDALLDAHDEALLVEGLGLSWDEVRALRGAWAKLRDRRRGRRRSRRV